MFANSQGLTMGFSQGTGSQEAKKRQEEKVNCLPVTIRSIEIALKQSSDVGGEVKFYGEEPGMLILVACVEAVVKQNTSCEMTLNDSTGRIKARFYQGEGSSLDDIAVGRYLNLFGQVRTAPAMHFAVTGFSQIESADEISYHMIESAHAAVKLQKGKFEPTTPSPKKPVNVQSTTTASIAPVPMDLTPAKIESAAPSLSAVSSKVSLSGDELKNAVLNYLKDVSPAAGDTGIASDDICKYFLASKSDEVKTTIKALVADGEVFTTIDDDHVQAI